MHIKRVSSIEEIDQIKILQNQNLQTNLEEEEIQKEGFLTAQFSIEFLELMHRDSPSIIAVDKGEVIGYVLVTTKAVLGHHPLIDDLFSNVDKQIYGGKSLEDIPYVLSGQLCVSKSYRGQGLAKQLYTFFKSSYSDNYSYCITDIDLKNPRSLQAHIKTGFKIIDTSTYGGSQWHIVLWDWNA